MPEPTARLLPGAVTRTSLRALLIRRTDSDPVAGLWLASGAEAPAPATVSVQPVQVPPALGSRLASSSGSPLTFFDVRASNLTAGERYVLRASGVDRPVEFRTLSLFDPTASLSIVVGSCYYDFFGDHARLDAMLASPHARNAAFALWIGDNLYADVAPGAASLSDAYVEMAQRYVRYFWQSPYAGALARLPACFTWDDHEFWNNYPEFQVHLSRSWGANRDAYTEASLAGLELFERRLNPPSVADGRSYVIDELPHVSIFVADMRTSRERWTGKASRMMTDADLQALEGWATRLDDRAGMLVLGQPLWLDAGSRLIDLSPIDFTDQYRRMWRAITRAKREIVIVSGDVHYSRLIRCTMRNDRGNVFEFVTSPVGHIPTEVAVATGSYGAQGGASVALDRQPGSRGDTDFVDLADYVMGTTAETKSSIGVLTFGPGTQGATRVEASFLEVGPNGAADLARLANTVSTGWFADLRATANAVPGKCFASFQLGRTRS